MRSVWLAKVAALFVFVTSSVLGCANTRTAAPAGPGYDAYVLRGGDDQPVFVLAYCTREDVAGFDFRDEFSGGWVPSAGQVAKADQRIAALLNERLPGRDYLRQYAGFRLGDTDYLWVQLTELQAITGAEVVTWDFDIKPIFFALNHTWDGGDSYGEIVFDVARDEVVYFEMNSTP